MDYSVKYCNMCFYALEIQSTFNDVKGPHILMERKSEVSYIMSRAISLNSGLVWLPTEDQLSGLMKEYSDSDYFTFVRSIYNSDSEVIAFNFFNSFEQYWLAYVMKLKFSKLWDGKAWIPIAFHE